MSKTQILGILTILSAVIGSIAALLKGGTVDYQSSITAIVAGVGLINSHPSNTQVSADAKPAPTS